MYSLVRKTQNTSPAGIRIPPGFFFFFFWGGGSPLRPPYCATILMLFKLLHHLNSH